MNDRRTVMTVGNIVYLKLPLAGELTPPTSSSPVLINLRVEGQLQCVRESGTKDSEDVHENVG